MARINLFRYFWRSLQSAAVLLLASGGVLLWASPAFAENSSGQLGEISTDTAGKAIPNLSLLGISTTLSGLQQTSDPNYSAETDFNLLATYRLSSSYSLLGSFGFRKELAQQMRLLGQDAVMGVMHNPIALNPYLKLTPSVGVRIPMSEQSLDYDSMYTGAQIGAELDLDGAAVGIKRLSFSYIGYLGRNFYKYIDSASGGILSTPNAPVPDNSTPQTPTPSPALINIEYDLKNFLLATYQLSRSFSFTETGIFIAGYDFDSIIHDNFQLCEELDYQLGKQVSVGVGFLNGGDVLMADGQSSNVQIYNPNSSNIYGSVILTY